MAIFLVQDQATSLALECPAQTLCLGLKTFEVAKLPTRGKTEHILLACFTLLLDRPLKKASHALLLFFKVAYSILNGFHRNNFHCCL